MGCGTSHPPQEIKYLDVKLWHDLKIKINKDFNQDYWCKKVTKDILKLSQHKGEYDKESQVLIENLITLLLTKRERLDSLEEKKHNGSRPHNQRHYTY